MTLQRLRQNISDGYCVDEVAHIEALRQRLSRDDQTCSVITERAKEICHFALTAQPKEDAFHRLLQEFELSTDEGVALMALTEALLRIPDQAVAAQFIADRLQSLDWESHFKDDSSSLINVSTFLLMLTGKVLTPSEQSQMEGTIHKFLRKVSQPIIHKAMTRTISLLAKQFVFAENITAALESVATAQGSADYFSLDMLGEEAISEQDAGTFHQSYEEAVKAIIASGLQDQSSISIKLSALHPRYDIRHEVVCLNGLYQRLLPLLQTASQHNLEITLDAEEASRLELSIDLFTRLFTDSFTDSRFGEISHLGMAVQAYGKRAMAVLEHLKHLAETAGRKIPIRLVKGAYWDTEIKQAQLDGLDDYPVYTHKHHTDIAYLACAEFLLANRHCFYPQFATHNAVTISDILYQAEPDGSYEFQRLHGMGEDIYAGVRALYPELKIRIYGPVGQYETLLPYLVRRILENGANSSFVNQFLKGKDNLDALCRHPLSIDTAYEAAIPLPKDIYLPSRENARGINLADRNERLLCLSELGRRDQLHWQSDLVVSEEQASPEIVPIGNPYDGSEVGTCHWFNADQVMHCLDRAQTAFDDWRQVCVNQRAATLCKCAKLMETHRYDLLSLLVREAGKTLPDAINELREAIDFAFYYARSAKVLASKEVLPHVAGESNHLMLRGRGPFLCISPWNFPLAIFTGQVCAALVSGNTVLAKPAEFTPLIARYVVDLLHQAGVPEDVVQLIPGDGSDICPDLCLDSRLAGVAFTGSTATAKAINKNLAEREGAIIPFIAETGGQNAMIVDSSALPEQVVKDVIQSAFFSAGQRCSALRVLYLQDEVYDETIAKLKGAMATLTMGNPAELATDIGPIITAQAKAALMHHCRVMEAKDRLIFKLETGDPMSSIMAPHVFEIGSIHELNEEHFGPILHVIRYQHGQVKKVVKEINDYGFGLTCGIHSRNERWARYIASQLNIGNVYINRDMVGAIVGAQPFGGQGLSGTGFKAGGPHYLLRFMNESTLTNNLSAIGGSLDLIAPKK